jgi:hypothetical protein
VGRTRAVAGNMALVFAGFRKNWPLVRKHIYIVVNGIYVLHNQEMTNVGGILRGGSNGG